MEQIIKKEAQRLRYRGRTYYLHGGVIYGPDFQVIIPEATNGFLDLYEYFEYFPQPELPPRSSSKEKTPEGLQKYPHRCKTETQKGG